MDRKQIIPILLSIYFLFISISTALRYQTFSEQPAQSEYDDHDYINNLSLELMHRDSFISYDSDLTPEILFNLRLQRDLLRVQSLSAQVDTLSDIDAASSSPVSSELSLGSGEYLARLGVGTPPQHFYLSLDTGSDVVWLQSYPCWNCYTQSDPIFDPKQSSSFSPLSCRSNLCQQLNNRGYCGDQDRCTYAVSYGDGSSTSGDFVNETMTFGWGTSVSNISLGCGHDNVPLFTIASAGLLGLSRGDLSFPVQTMNRFGGKFSYCLVDPRSSSSTILFGEQQSVSKNVVYTPLLGNTLYYVNLIGISVDHNPVPGINPSVFGGGVIIDSGTTITRLAEPAYEALKEAFNDRVSGFAPTSGFSTFDTCYNSSSGSTGPNASVPTMTLHFDGGADMQLPAENYFVPVNNNEMLCLAFAPSPSGLSIIGNLQQQGFRVMYDLAASRVGFAPHSFSC